MHRFFLKTAFFALVVAPHVAIAFDPEEAIRMLAAFELRVAEAERKLEEYQQKHDEEIGALDAQLRETGSHRDLMMNANMKLKKQIKKVNKKVKKINKKLRAVDKRVTLLENKTKCISKFSTDTDFIVSSCNLQVLSGTGKTTASNGKGNLILGYNDKTGCKDCKRSGSHNIIVGDGHDWTSYGGVVFGNENIIGGNYASVLGGKHNSATGNGASVLGGFQNKATGGLSAISGGRQNKASATHSAVSGGKKNVASGSSSSVLGGESNTAAGTSSAVLGGYREKARKKQQSIPRPGTK